MRRFLALLALCTALATPAYAQVSGLLQYFYTNITGQGTLVLKSGPGQLHTVTINTPTATETIKIYDGISVAAGTIFATITVPASPMPVTLTYDVNFGKGLTVVTATASSDITVSYR